MACCHEIAFVIYWLHFSYLLTFVHQHNDHNIHHLIVVKELNVEGYIKKKIIKWYLSVIIHKNYILLTGQGIIGP